MRSLSIVIPAYNEEKRIGPTLEAYGEFFNKACKANNFVYKILVVINGTTDKTEEIVKKYQKINKNIKYLNFKQGGKGFAVIEGFKKSLEDDFELIGYVDADMATLPEAFYELVEKIDRYDGIIANRWLKSSIIKNQTFLRKVLSRGFNFIVRVFFLFPYTDTQCGAKLFRRKIIELVTKRLGATEWAFDIDLLYLCRKNNFKIKQIPTIWEDKAYSKINISRTPLQMFLGVLRLRLIYSLFEPILRPVKFLLAIGDKLVNKK